jgi:7-carboxy-7-deazaguanine synthase
MNNNDLRITEIFYSLQGETKTVGLPTVFVRLTGCPLRCQYCDTAYAFKGGTKLSIANILDQVASYKPRFVTVTGGEPLAQPGAISLLTNLVDKNYQVSLETSGALDVSKVDSRVVKVLDIKTPGSKEEHRNLYNNLKYLTDIDQIKFVICSLEDYRWAKDKLQEYKLANICEVLFSPSYGQIDARELAELIVADNLPVRFQMQLHKLIWNDEAGR